MPQLSRNVVRESKVHQRAVNMAPAKGGGVYFTGGYLWRDGQGRALSGVPDPVEGGHPLGVLVETLYPGEPDKAIHHHIDNADGADGVLDRYNRDRCVRYDQTGEYAFDVVGSTPIVGAQAYVVDDNTMTADQPDPAIVAGWFTRPSDRSDQWFVDISKRGMG